MSLTVALNSAIAGINQAEQQISVVSSNITNASNPDYTRKVLQSQSLESGLVTLPVGGIAVQAVSDPLLAKQVSTEGTVAGYTQTLSTYLSNYSESYGTTAATASTLSSNMDTLLSTLETVEEDPTNDSAKSEVVSAAEVAASTLNGLSQNVQAQRLQANNDIGNTVTDINTDLQTIASLNKQIGTDTSAGTSVGDLEDQRTAAIQDLSQQLGVQYFTNSDNQMLVYTTGGGQLVSPTSYTPLSYTPVGTVAASTTYPGGFSPITLGNVDITDSVTTGNLGALITLRDTTFPGEQAKLDSFSNTLQSTVNNALNQGSAYPPLTTVAGTTPVTASTSMAGSTGTLRVAVMDQTGFVQNYTDIDLSSCATVGDLMTALNGISGVSASLDSNGNLDITSTNAADGISLNPMDSNVSGTGTSATQFFGFNSLFTNDATGASTIEVNPNLISNSAGLATGSLSNSATLANGDRGLSSGDASITTGLINTLDGTQTFSAAGDFGVRTSTLSDYGSAIIADAAAQATAAQTNSDTASASLSYLTSNLSNETGVNIDQETANLTLLQNNYQASAQVISTVQTLFTSLLTAVEA